MTIKTARPMNEDTAHYILKEKGWKYRDGDAGSGKEIILSVREDGGIIAEREKFTRKITIHEPMHEQELIALLVELRVI